MEEVSEHLFVAVGGGVEGCEARPDDFAVVLWEAVGLRVEVAYEEQIRAVWGVGYEVFEFVPELLPVRWVVAVVKGVERDDLEGGKGGIDCEMEKPTV